MATVTENLTPTTSRAVSFENAKNSALSPRLFTVAEYERMIELGILNADEKVELIEGRILTMSPKGKPHAAATDRATRFFITRLGARVIVRNQNPIRLSDSEPEPDIALAVPSEKEYADHHPTPEEILLVVEVADSSLDFDRHLKSAVYAGAGIMQYLLLNVNRREVEDYREPSADGYRSKRTFRADESFSLVAFPDVEVKAGDLLPPE